MFCILSVYFKFIFVFFFRIIQVENKLQLFPHYGNQKLFLSMPYTVQISINIIYILMDWIDHVLSQKLPPELWAVRDIIFQIFVVFYVSFRFTDPYDHVARKFPLTYIFVYNIILFRYTFTLCFLFCFFVFFKRRKGGLF